MNHRHAGLLLLVLALPAACGASQTPGSGTPKSDSGAKAAVANAECDGKPAGTAQFDRSAADGMLRTAGERAMSCVQGALNIDLTVSATFGPGGCISKAELQSKLPSTMSDCVLKRYKETTIPAFSGAPTTVRVRMTNERVWVEF